MLVINELWRRTITLWACLGKPDAYTKAVVIAQRQELGCLEGGSACGAQSIPWHEIMWAFQSLLHKLQKTKIIAHSPLDRSIRLQTVRCQPRTVVRWPTELLHKRRIQRTMGRLSTKISGQRWQWKVVWDIERVWSCQCQS